MRHEMVRLVPPEASAISGIVAGAWVGSLIYKKILEG